MKIRPISAKDFFNRNVPKENPTQNLTNPELANFVAPAIFLIRRNNKSPFKISI